MTKSNKQHTRLFKPFLGKLFGFALLFGFAGAADAAAPTFAKAFSPATIGPGSISTITFTINNNAEAAGATALAFTDTLPANVTVATPAQLTSDCGIPTLTGAEGGNTIVMSGGTVGPLSSCTVTVNVTSATPGLYTNVSGDLTSDAGNSGTATADLTVSTALPGFSKSFSPASVNLGARSTLTFTIDNSLNAALITNLDFTDNLPSGMVVASPANASTNCEGLAGTTLTAIPEAGVITLDAYGTVTFPALAAGATCTVDVDVVASSIGSLANTTELVADWVSAGLAGATLDVSADELTFYKSFTDDPVVAGGTATLRYDIVNRNRFDPATAMAFSDDLAAMLAGTTVVSVDTDTCGGVSDLSVPGSFSYSGGSVAADGGACAIQISLNIPGAVVEGIYPSTSSTIAASSGTFSAASESLFVFAAPVISKSFTDDPAVAGGTVTLEYTITNPSATDPMTDIGFSEEFIVILTTVSAGPTATSCGGGETVTFTPLDNPLGFPTTPAKITLSGASLAAGASCTISITLDILQTASGGSYTSTSDPVSGVINGTTRTGNQATDNLLVVSAPSFSKLFTDAPAAPGGSVTLEFNLSLSASAPGDVSNIAFSDDVDAMLTGTVVSSVDTDTCGGTATGVGSGLFGYSAGVLTPDASCSVSITLAVDAAAAPDTYTNTTSAITADADDGTTATHAVSGPAAEDDLLVTGLVFSKAFIDDPSLPGDTVTLRYTIDNSASPLGQDATAIVFTDDFDAALAGLAATNLPLADACGVSSSVVGTVGNSLLTFTGGNLLAGTSCSFDVTLQIPGPDGSYISATGTLLNPTPVATIGGNVITLPPATDTLVVKSDYLTLSKSFIDDPLAVGGTGTLQYVLGVDAASPGTVDNISFTDDLDATLSGLIFTGTSTSTDCTGLTLTPATGGVVSVSGVSLAPSASCTITLDLAVPAGVTPGYYASTSSTLTGSIGGLPGTGSAASDTLTIRAAGLGLSFSKAFSGSGVSGGTVNLSFTLQNEDSVSGIASLAFNDDLNAVIPGLVSITAPQADVCGTGSLFSGTSLLTLTNGDLGASGSCTINVTLQIPSTAPTTYLNTTSQLFSSGLVVNDPASATLTVLNTAPVNSVLPVISGTASVGSQLSSDTGTWTDADGDTLTYTYQWKADNNDITGANGSDYVATNAELGAVLTVAVTANDSNGGSATVVTAATSVIDGGLDDVAPIVTVTADVNVNATGLYTAVDVGVITAYDLKDGDITPTLASLNGKVVTAVPTHYQPGVNTLIWSAVDLDGNTGTAVQLINVTPLVSFSQDQIAREGDSVTFKAILNGLAVSYPVTVPYTLTGTAATDLSDHDLVNGDITITSSLETSVTVNLVDDGAGEGSENLVVTMGIPSNAVKGAVNVHTIEISEINVTPQVTLSADQGQGNTHLVVQSGGVVVTAAVTDSVADVLSYDWAATDNALINNSANENSFNFDPLELQPGIYTLRVAVSDGSDISESEILLNIVANAPVLAAVDTDGDGINDDAEGYVDSDGDGIPDYLDDSGLAGNVASEQAGINDRFLMETEPGLELSPGNVLFRASGVATNVSINEITVYGNNGAGAQDDHGFNYSSGLFDFSISSLPTAGASVRVVIAQFAAIPAGAVYRKLMPSGWQYFEEDASNALASAPGEEGICPPPGDAAYVAGLNEGDWCVQLTIQDGGPNDADGLANQSISDPGGVTQNTSSDYDNNSILDRVFGGASSIWLLMMLGLLPLRRKWLGSNRKMH